ncbi:MAG: ParA family protein [Thermodesulfovibrionales bacterium]
MRRIITIASQKGGVGKTTTTLNLGYNLSRLGGRVLIVDGDPQGGISIASNLKKKTSKGIIDVLKKECNPRDIVMTTRENTLSVVGIGTMEPEDVLFFEAEAARGRLKELLRTLSLDYSYVLVDAPAGVGGIVMALLSASDSVIMVVQCRTLSLKTLPSFLKLVQWVKGRQNALLVFEGVVITMLNEKNPYELQLYDEAKKMFPEEAFFRTMIPYDDLFEQASSRAVPIAMLRGGKKAGSIYMDLAMELKERELKREMGGEGDDDAEGLF